MWNSPSLRAVAAAAVLATAFAGLAPGSARADRSRAGARVLLLPSGRLEGRYETPFGVITGETDTAVAGGIGFFLDGALGRYATIGLAPQYLFNVKADGTGDSTEELDLMARLTLWYPAAERVALCAYLAPGYSVIFPDTDEGDAAKGFVFGFGAGAELDLSPRAFVSAEVGYQLGFQALTFLGEEVAYRTQYLHLAAGVGTRF